MLGGRWTGSLKMKQGVVAAVGRPGLMTEPAEHGYADQARKRDIDIQGMRDEAADKAGKQYDAVARLFGGSIPEMEILWKDITKKKNFTDADRKRYHNQPAMKALKAIQERKDLTKAESDALFFIELDDYQGGRDAYVGRAIRDAVSFFAVVKDGKWYERGKMGWWACVADKKEGDQWAEEQRKLLDSVPDDTLLSVFDCHV